MRRAESHSQLGDEFGYGKTSISIAKSKLHILIGFLMITGQNFCNEQGVLSVLDLNFYRSELVVGTPILVFVRDAYTMILPPIFWNL